MLEHISNIWSIEAVNNFNLPKRSNRFFWRIFRRLCVPFPSATDETFPCQQQNTGLEFLKNFKSHETVGQFLSSSLTLLALGLKKWNKIIKPTGLKSFAGPEDKHMKWIRLALFPVCGFSTSRETRLNLVFTRSYQKENKIGNFLISVARPKINDER